MTRQGRGGDHSELSAEDGTTAKHRDCRNTVKARQLAVRQHLLMSMTHNEDISDPDKVKDLLKSSVINVLDYLLCTVADITATNPELWTS